LPAKSGADQGPRSTRTCAKSRDRRGKDADMHAQDAPLPFAPRPSRHRPGPRQNQTGPHLQSCGTPTNGSDLTIIATFVRVFARRGPRCNARARYTVATRAQRARSQRRSDLASPVSNATPAAFTITLRFSSLPSSRTPNCSPRTPARGRSTPRQSTACRVPAAGTPWGAKACTGPVRHSASAASDDRRIAT
jgi:hypothetical protein